MSKKDDHLYDAQHDNDLIQACTQALQALPLDRAELTPQRESITKIRQQAITRLERYERHLQKTIHETSPEHTA